MRKIALKGLIGQKHDTVLLWSVVALSFLFLILSTTLITSLQKTDEAQRVSTYGSWQINSSYLSKEEANAIASCGDVSAVLPLVNVYGTDYFTGDNEYFITPISDSFIKLGDIRLEEGRWPENMNEIVLEYARLSSLGLNIGDTFIVISEVQLQKDPVAMKEQEDYEKKLIETAKEAFIEEQIEIHKSGEWKNLINANPSMNKSAENMFFEWFDKNKESSEIKELFGGKSVDLENITEEELRIALDYYFEENHAIFNLYRFLPEEAKYIKEAISDLVGSGYSNIRVSGRNDILYIYIPHTYTICGIVETFSDRWDTGLLPLPSGFITEECYEDYITCQNAVLDEYGDYLFKEYNHSVFIASESLSARKFWDETRNIYNEKVTAENSFTNAYYFRSKDEAFWQIGFDVNLYSKDTEERKTANAWLIPEESFKDDYQKDFAIAENSDYFSSVVIDIDEIKAADGSKIFMYDENHVLFELFVPELSEAKIAFNFNSEYYEIPFFDFIEGNFSIEGYNLYREGQMLYGAFEEQDDFSEFRLNSFAYPSSTEDSGRMLVFVMVILFVTTVAAVFQIFFTQMKKRLRRIVLMKSIGAKSAQIGQMLLWEFIYFLAASLPIGIILGLGGAYLSTGILGKIQEREILFTVDPLIFIFAMLAGTFALFAGMVIPMIMAVGVPLTGRTVRKKPLAPPKKETVQNFKNITIRGLFANRTRTLGNFALCIFMMLITSLCLFIGFRFMTPYRETVQRDARPDYFLQLPFSASDRQLPEYIAELEALGVCDEIEVQRTSTDAILQNGSFESVLLDTAFGNNLKTVSDSYGAGDFSGYPIELYSISPESGIFERFASSVTKGSIDKKAFESGEEVILMIPLYHESGKINESAIKDATGWERVSASGTDITFYEEYKNIYDVDSSVTAGKYITLGAITRYMGGNSYTYKLETAKVKVGAVIHYFPGEGIWPISGSGEGFQVICSSKLATEILPNSMRTRSSNEIRAFKIMYMSTGYGTTDFYINAKEGLSKYEVDTALLVYARNEYMDIEFYHESNSKLLQDGINNILFICLLGLTAVLLALIIFSNTVASDIEQERNRIGILQSLGVSNKQLIRRQLYIGLCASGMALVISNLLLWLGIAIYSALTDEVFGNLLWGYPTWLHIALCLLLAAVITVLYIIPMYGLRHYLPIENIKTRK